MKLKNTHSLLFLLIDLIQINYVSLHFFQLISYLLYSLSFLLMFHTTLTKMTVDHWGLILRYNSHICLLLRPFNIFKPLIIILRRSLSILLINHSILRCIPIDLFLMDLFLGLIKSLFQSLIPIFNLFSMSFIPLDSVLTFYLTPLSISY